MTIRSADEYVAEVMDRIPRAVASRRRIEADLRLHLAEMLADEPAAPVVLERMGPPDEVAAEFLAQIPLVPASHGRRFAAFVADIVVILIPFVPLVALVVGWGADHPGVPFVLAASMLFGVLAILYFPVMEGLWGQTAGKRLAGLCVVREDGTRAGWVAVLLRRLPFFMNFFPIDALFVFFTARRQRAFDKVAGTLVIDCRRPRPSLPSTVR